MLIDQADNFYLANLINYSLKYESTTLKWDVQVLLSTYVYQTFKKNSFLIIPAENVSVFFHRI